MMSYRIWGDLIAYRPDRDEDPSVGVVELKICNSF